MPEKPQDPGDPHVHVHLTLYNPGREFSPTEAELEEARRIVFADMVEFQGKEAGVVMYEAGEDDLLYKR